jgi:hypothetical protein
LVIFKFLLISNLTYPNLTMFSSGTPFDLSCLYQFFCLLTYFVLHIVEVERGSSLSYKVSHEKGPLLVLKDNWGIILGPLACLWPVCEINILVARAAEGHAHLTGGDLVMLG